MKISSGDLPPLSRKRGQGEYTSLLHQELARNEAPVLDEHGRLPGMLPIVLYNGEAPWQSVLEVSELIQPVDKALAPYRPSQRYCVLDERHVGEDDLPSRNLVTTVALLERIRSPWDLIRVARMLRHWLRRPEDDELRRVFAAWVRETAEPLVPPWQALAPEMTLEDIEMTLVERVAEWAPPHPEVTPSSTRSMPRACDSRLWAGDDVGGGGGGAQYVGLPRGKRRLQPSRASHRLSTVSRSSPDGGTSRNRHTDITAEVAARDSPGSPAPADVQARFAVLPGARPTKEGNFCPVGSGVRCP